MINTEVRKVTLRDLVALQSISRQTFIETFADVNKASNMQKYLDENLSLERLQSEFNHPESEFYFATYQDRILGYLKLNFGLAQTEPVDPKSLEIERIYVLKEFQGTGVGKILFDFALQKATRLNSEFIWLGVWEKNFKALRFYAKFGFKEFDRHLFKLGDDVQTDLLMKYQLDNYE